MSRSVYAITQGQYSDYRVLFVFDERTQAEAYLAKVHARFDSCEIEEFTLYGDDAPDPVVWFEESAYVMADGSVEGHDVQRYAEPYQAGADRLRGWVSNLDWRLADQYGDNHPKRLEVHAQGPDLEGVHKVYGERLFFAQEAVKTGQVGVDHDWGRG